MRLTVTPSRWTLAALGLLALAGMLLISLPGRPGWWGAFAATLGALCCGLRGIARARADRYDLRRLSLAEDATAPEHEDAPEGAVYCAWCDEAFDATEPRCPRCGRPF